MEDNSGSMYFDEEGCSSYSRRNMYATEVQKLELQLVIKLLDEQVEALDKTEGPFTVADFGTADGAGFIQILPALVEEIRSRLGQNKQVSVVFEDGPENDFKSVFRNVSGTSFELTGLCQQLKEVFVSASGTSFYQQCFPDNTLSLACSTSALHFLSTRPCVTDNYFPWIYGDKKYELFKKQGEEDLEAFLLHRAKELKRGGIMVLFVIGMDEEGRYTGYTRHKDMDKTLSDLWIDFCEKGIITKEEIQRSTYPAVIRTQDDLRKPFDKEGSPVKTSGLRLHSIEKIILKSPTYEHLLQSYKEGVNNTEEVLEYTRGLVNSMKSWSYMFKYRALDASRKEEEKRAILDSYFAEMENIVSKNPLDYVMDYVYFSVLITKD